MTEPKMHLYWAWEQGANGRELLRITAAGFAICGKRVLRSQLTTLREDTTCRECLKKVKLNAFRA